MVDAQYLLISAAEAASRATAINDLLPSPYGARLVVEHLLPLVHEAVRRGEFEAAYCIEWHRLANNWGSGSNEADRVRYDSEKRVVRETIEKWFSAFGYRVAYENIWAHSYGRGDPEDDCVRFTVSWGEAA